MSVVHGFLLEDPSFRVESRLAFFLLVSRVVRDKPRSMTALFTPAHLHLALNHIPIIGLAVACLPVLIGILFHSRGALASGLLAVLLCAGTTPAIMETGEGAREAFVDGSVQPPMDDAGNAAFHQHSGRARIAAPFVYAAGLLALVALIALIRFPRQAAWIGWGVLAGCAISIGLCVWTAEAGGRIRHLEFRPESSAPAPSPDQAPVSVPTPAPVISPLVTEPSATPSPEGRTNP